MAKYYIYLMRVSSTVTLIVHTNEETHLLKNLLKQLKNIQIDNLNVTVHSENSVVLINIETNYSNEFDMENEIINLKQSIERIIKSYNLDYSVIETQDYMGSKHGMKSET